MARQAATLTVTAFLGPRLVSWLEAHGTACRCHRYGFLFRAKQLRFLGLGVYKLVSSHLSRISPINEGGRSFGLVLRKGEERLIRWVRLFSRYRIERSILC